ncbi:MAG: Hsp20 family protein, partial [Halobacteria archaeon]|nr:Hsp20 family protein [Halobacteria archaeon]
YMATRLLELAEENDSVVAIVGAGHKSGIENYLENPETIPDVGEPEESSSVTADVVENDDEVLVLIDLPGSERDDIQLSFSDSRLRVEARTRKPFESDTEYRYIVGNRPELVTASFDIPADADVNAEEATTKYENGVLRVELPKK